MLIKLVQASVIFDSLLEIIFFFFVHFRLRISGNSFLAYLVDKCLLYRWNRICPQVLLESRPTKKRAKESS